MRVAVSIRGAECIKAGTNAHTADTRGADERVAGSGHGGGRGGGRAYVITGGRGGSGGWGAAGGAAWGRHREHGWPKSKRNAIAMRCARGRRPAWDEL